MAPCKVPPEGAETPEEETPTQTPEEQLNEALADAQRAYGDAQAALREGDFAAYGDAIDRLGAALDRAAELSGVPVEEPPLAEPVPSPEATDTPVEEAETVALGDVR